MRPALLSLLPSLIAAQVVPRTWDEAKTMAAATVASLTLDEKAGLMTGLGQFGSQCVGNTHAVDRLGLPSICLNDGPAGVRLVDLVSAFPAGINAAATFNRDLIRQRGVAIGEEFRTKGAHVFLGPAIDPMRNGLGGRAWESFGADPWFNGEAGFETIHGVQSVGVQAVAKHFLAYVQEHYRFTYSAEVDNRTLHEIYWQPYMRAIDADVSSVMCMYARFNLTYACQDPFLMSETGLLKGEGGFKGYIMSDWGATHGGAADTANAGLDMEQPGDWILIGGGVYDGLFFNGGTLVENVKNGNVNESLIDTMVTRILTPYYRLRQESGFPATSFNVQSASNSQNLHVNARTDAHTQLIRKIGGASAVLLKNVNNALPFKSGLKSLAVLGSDAGYAKKDCDMNTCANGTVSIGWGSGTTLLEYLIPPIAALSTQGTAKNFSVTSSLTENASDGAKAAALTEAAVVFLKSDSGEIGGGLTQVEGNFGDRNDYYAWYNGDGLVNAVAAVNKNTVVVIHSVGPVEVEAWINHPNVTAVIMAGLPGEQSGPSIVDVLWGAVNPSGRLPYTIAKQREDYPNDILYFSWDPNPVIPFTEGLFLDYRHFDQNSIEPRFEFGYGLSYTTFSYSNLVISSSSQGVSVKFSVKNTGTIAGTEIPQVYLGFPPATGEPPKVLRGFTNVDLSPKASSTVTINLRPEDLHIWDNTQLAWIKPAGTFTVYVGASSRDIRLQGTF